MTPRACIKCLDSDEREDNNLQLAHSVKKYPSYVY